MNIYIISRSGRAVIADHAALLSKCPIHKNSAAASPTVLSDQPSLHENFRIERVYSAAISACVIPENCAAGHGEGCPLVQIHAAAVIRPVSCDHSALEHKRRIVCDKNAAAETCISARDDPAKKSTLFAAFGRFSRQCTVIKYKYSVGVDIVIMRKRRVAVAQSKLRTRPNINHGIIPGASQNMPVQTKNSISVDLNLVRKSHILRQIIFCGILLRSALHRLPRRICFPFGSMVMRSLRRSIRIKRRFPKNKKERRSQEHNAKEKQSCRRFFRHWERLLQ